MSDSVKNMLTFLYSLPAECDVYRSVDRGCYCEYFFQHVTNYNLCFNHNSLF